MNREKTKALPGPMSNEEFKEVIVKQISELKPEAILKVSLTNNYREEVNSFGWVESKKDGTRTVEITYKL